MRVVIGDDHEMFLEALQDLLLWRGHVVLDVCTDLDDVVASVSTHRPDVCLLDLDFGGHSSITAATAIRDRHPEVGLLVLTGATTPEVWQAFENKVVDGVVNKLCDFGVLNRAMEQVLDGRQVVERFGRPAALRAARPRVLLSTREKEVLVLLVEGASTPEIATRLLVSDQTVRTHVRSVLRKLGVNTRSRAVRLAVESGSDLLEPRAG